MYFAWRVFWPESSAQAPFSGRLEWGSLAIAAAAAIALVWRRAEVIPVIGASAAAGLALWALGLQGAI